MPSTNSLKRATGYSGQTLDVTSEESRVNLAKLLTKLFDLWKLSTVEQLELLGQSPNSRANLSKYRQGSPLPNLRDLLDRTGWLLAIHKALRLLYPYNDILRYSWIKQRNKAFDNLTPLELMQQEGIIGIAKVSRYLDFQRGR